MSEPTEQTLKLDLLTGDDMPDSHKKTGELIYELKGIGRIYTRQTIFKPDLVKAGKIPTSLQLVVDSPSPVWAEDGDHPRSGRGRPAVKKDKYTPAEIKEMEDKLKKTQDRLAKMRGEVEEAKKKVDPNAPPAEAKDDKKSDKKKDLPS